MSVMVLGPEYQRLGLSVALACAATLAGTTAQAQDGSLLSVNREVAVGAETLFKRYKEAFPAGAVGFDREDGFTAGLVARASWMTDAHHLYAAVQYRFDSGTIGFKGSALGTNTPVTQDSGLTNHDLLGEIGKGFMLTPRLLVTPVVQVGYHAWDRDLSTTQSETYQHVLLGAAVRADYALAPRWVGRLRLGAGETIDPNITVNLGGRFPADLGSRPVYQAALGLDYAATARVHAFAEADFQHYGYGRSAAFQTPTQRLFEPASRTDDLHLAAGVGYSF